MSVKRVGSTQKYVAGWERVFGGQTARKSAVAAKKPKPTTKAAAPKPARTARKPS